MNMHGRSAGSGVASAVAEVLVRGRGTVLGTHTTGRMGASSQIHQHVGLDGGSGSDRIPEGGLGGGS